LRLRRVYLVFKKDWREVVRNPQIMLPLILVPLAFSTVFPFIIGSVQRLALSDIQSRGLEALIRNMPEQLRAELLKMTAQQVLFYVLSVYFYAPLFLMIPIMVSSVIASDSFAGEKERKTLEALLATPLRESELFLGKVLVSLVPALLATLGSFIAYSATVNIVSTTLLNGPPLLPNPVWAVLVLAFAPAIACACIGLTVTVSAWVKGFREAQQISVLLVFPIVCLMFGQLLGMFVLEPRLVGALAGLFTLFDMIIFYYGTATFNRESILSRHV